MQISVALCTYNGAKYIGQQLDSILQQSVPIHEIVVCDDGSADSTISILQKYAATNAGLIKIHVNQKKRGPEKNFEKCIGLCSGDIIFLSDQDDVWHENKVQKISDIFKENGAALMVFTNGNLIDAEGNKMEGTLWSKWNFTEDMRNRWKNQDMAFDDLVRNRNKVTGATAALSKKLLPRLFPFRSNEHYWHDAWIAMYAAAQRGLFFIEESLIDYRVHDAQLVGIGNGSTIKKAAAKNKTTIASTVEQVAKKVYRKINRK